jgi:hypothetical protein
MDVQRKVYRLLATVAAGFVASHAVAIAWRIATKEKAPEDTEDLTVQTSRAVIFAAVLGAATAAAQTLAARKALWIVGNKERPTVAAALAPGEAPKG